MKQLALVIQEPGDKGYRTIEAPATADARFAELCRAPLAGWPAADDSMFGAGSGRESDPVSAWSFGEERELPLVM